MKVKSINKNQTEIHLNNGNVVLVSYETPVAAYLPQEGYVATEQKYSVTTSKHIGDFAGIPYKSLNKKPQSFFNSLLG